MHPYIGPGYLIVLIQHLQKECDTQSTRILGEFKRYRKLQEKVCSFPPLTTKYSSSSCSSNNSSSSSCSCSCSSCSSSSSSCSSCSCSSCSNLRVSYLHTPIDLGYVPLVCPIYSSSCSSSCSSCSCRRLEGLSGVLSMHVLLTSVNK